MLIQLRITHVQSGQKWCGEASEVTAAELEEVNDALKENIKNITYLEVDGDILPGDFIRKHCVLRFIILD